MNTKWLKVSHLCKLTKFSKHSLLDLAAVMPLGCTWKVLTTLSTSIVTCNLSLKLLIHIVLVSLFESLVQQLLKRDKSAVLCTGTHMIHLKFRLISVAVWFLYRPHHRCFPHWLVCQLPKTTAYQIVTPFWAESLCWTAGYCQAYQMLQGSHAHYA